MFHNVGTKERLVDRVVNEIETQIREGRLVPGMMLPPERELCEQLGVSRTALREAVRMLVSRGLLETRPGVGTTVRLLTSDHITQPLSMMLSQAGPINLDHLNQVRQILDVEIARLAAREATTEDLDRLQEIYQDMIEVDNDHEAFNELDAEFHHVMAEITHNPLLVLLQDSIRDAIQSVRELVVGYPELVAVVLPDHEQILKYIREKDAGEAGKAMRAHLEHARSIQKAVLGNGNSDHIEETKP